MTADAVPLEGERFHFKFSVCNCSGIVWTVEETGGPWGEVCLGLPTPQDLERGHEITHKE